MSDVEKGDPIDLTPSPRVLRMLGQIEFKPWQCLAELIDNAVDAFLAMEPSTRPAFPQVNVEVSSVNDIKAGVGVIEVADNGPGMSTQKLQDAVRAGFSSNNSVDKLGLFGMGFNVATARLGHRTELWTTRPEDDYWTGVRIDFDEMERSGSFHAPALRRRKMSGEDGAHGTKIVISKVERERALYLRSGQGGKATRAKLSRVYNRIMRDIQLEVIVCGAALEPREFCVWGANRSVETKTAEAGRVPARLEVDVDLGVRPYCGECWYWLLDGETKCPVCGQESSVTLRPRRISGWLGIQRYFDQTDYGIDLIRNGRVIEERSKVFFNWTKPDSGEDVVEYPLEQTHWGGRIVGELNIDFVPLASHQKDAFDKACAEWRQVVSAVHGDGPILPKLRESLGYPGRAESPLSRLHAAFRRGSPPGVKHLVPGDSRGQGINEEPKRWAHLFYSGDAAYQSDEPWWEAVLAAEEAKNRKKGADIPEDLDDPEAEAPDEPARGPDAPPSAPPKRGDLGAQQFVEDPALTGSFELPEVVGSPKLDIRTRRLVVGRLPGGVELQFVTAGTKAEFDYDPSHPAFSEAIREPSECLLQEVAYQLLNRSTTTQREWPLSRVVEALRQKYAKSTVASAEEVRRQAESLLREVVEHLDEQLPTIAPFEVSVLLPEERDVLAREVARVDRAGADRVEEVITQGHFAGYLGGRFAADLFERWPSLALDGTLFNVAYASVSPDLRAEMVRQVATALRDVQWAVEPGAVARGSEHWRLLLGRAWTSVRLLTVWKA